MQYFPFSYIINLSNTINTITETIVRHAYFCDWNVGKSEDTTPVETERLEISELYY